MATQKVKEEALAESKQITWRDQKFTILPADEWMLDFLHYVERDSVTLALEAMLGSEQYERFRTTEPRPKISELQGLMASITSAFGVDMGEA